MNHEDHYRLVYINNKTGDMIVSMTHQPKDKAVSMAAMLNQYAQFGRFRAEDEWDVIREQVA